MKLTDEIVARALGWSKSPSPMNPKCKLWFPPKSNNYTSEVPSFTTSLDAIVAEIEARQLEWYVSHRWSTNKEFDGYNGRVEIDKSRRTGDTAPLALCAALLAYLKLTLQPSIWRKR